MTLNIFCWFFKWRVRLNICSKPLPHFKHTWFLEFSFLFIGSLDSVHGTVLWANENENRIWTRCQYRYFQIFCILSCLVVDQSKTLQRLMLSPWKCYRSPLTIESIYIPDFRLSGEKISQDSRLVSYMSGTYGMKQSSEPIDRKKRSE